MSVKNRTNLKASNDTTFADNTSGDISAGDGRNELDDLADSCVNLIDDQYPRFAVTTGTATAYAVTVRHPAAYTVGLKISVQIHTDNTGADPTINVTPTGGSALGTQTIKDREGSAIAAGDLQQDQFYDIQYDGTDFRIVAGYGGGAAISGTPTAGEVADWANSTTVRGSGMFWETEDIGDWDMDTSSTSSFITFTGVDFKKVRLVTAVIRNDADTIYYAIDKETDSSGGRSVSVNQILDNSGDTRISLARADSGFFDSTNFNSTSYNRGWVTIMYVS